MKILAVDDEPLARERLLRLLQKIVPDAEVHEAGNGRQALQEVAAWQPDLVMLDIRMPGMDGIEVASELQSLSQPPAIIFCTAYDEYAMEALENQAVAYLMKPVREEKLRAAIERAGRVNRVELAVLGGEESVARTHVVSEDHRGVEMIPVNEVRCFLAEQKYVRAVHPEGGLLIPDTLKDLEEEFASSFLRVHRNALVALAHIDALRKGGEEGWVVALLDVAEQPQVSRRHLSALKERIRQR